MKLTVLLFIIVFVLAGCASQKSVQDASPEKTYTNDDTTKTEGVTTSADTSVQETKIHIVQKGESLSVIAKKYGVSVQDIVNANNIENVNLIKINQKLIIPKRKKD